MKDLLSLLYVSNAWPMTDTDIQAVLEVSRSNNLKEDITGCFALVVDVSFKV
ncbi:BLUF domain-containing protein [Marinospirillum celere]|uniref:BLUF domain-containing protein n=1 Tax=Marinospirillum celere TaxID=1122252 RepID=UPI001160A98B|nr:BLUF domain-containing protein [Marinospirillum celere]